jgi:hypothetical protein
MSGPALSSRCCVRVYTQLFSCERRMRVRGAHAIVARKHRRREACIDEVQYRPQRRVQALDRADPRGAVGGTCGGFSTASPRRGLRRPHVRTVEPLVAPRDDRGGGGWCDGFSVVAAAVADRAPGITTTFKPRPGTIIVHVVQTTNDGSERMARLPDILMRPGRTGTGRIVRVQDGSAFKRSWDSAPVSATPRHG